VAGGQGARQLAGEKPVAMSFPGLAEAEQNEAEPPVLARQERDAARLRGESGGGGEAALERRQAGLDRWPCFRRHAADRDRPRGFVDEGGSVRRLVRSHGK
jgi:hypothetical protein